MTKEIATKDQQVPEFLRARAAESARGNEDVTIDDLTVPMLKIAQALSPCVQKGDPDYNADAEVGMLYNSVTGELYGQTVDIIFLKYRVEWLIWNDMSFRGSYKTEAEAVEAMRLLTEEPKLVIQRTPTHYAALIGSNGDLSPIVIPMTSTKEKISKRINSIIALRRGDRFSSVFKLSTTEETSKTNGKKYYNFKVSLKNYVDEKQFKKSEELYALVSDGGVNADYTDAI